MAPVTLLFWGSMCERGAWLGDDAITEDSPSQVTMGTKVNDVCRRLDKVKKVFMPLSNVVV
jgi:hypothetical protein